MLPRVCDLQKAIATFLRQKNLPYADQFFEVKLLLCEAQLANGQLEHFPGIAACVLLCPRFLTLHVVRFRCNDVR